MSASPCSGWGGRGALRANGKWIIENGSCRVLEIARSLPIIFHSPFIIFHSREARIISRFQFPAGVEQPPPGWIGLGSIFFVPVRVFLRVSARLTGGKAPQLAAETALQKASMFPVLVQRRRAI
jgi:hypothetical protein